MPKVRSTSRNKPNRLERLAAFGVEFRDPTTMFGTWHDVPDNATAWAPHTFPWFDYSEVADRFQKMLYDSGWIQDFDWARWKDGDEGRTLLAHRDAIATADCGQLAKVLTTLVRQDRFVDGALAEAYENKILLAVVERAEVLRQLISKSAKASK
jgi:uncharacterized protein DUF6508